MTDSNGLNLLLNLVHGMVYDSHEPFQIESNECQKINETKAFLIVLINRIVW